jgi:hypothetical protein
VRVGAALAVACATLLAVAAACRFTGDLTGGPAEDGGGDDASLEGGDCDADLARSLDNCGACGHACVVGPNALATCIDGGCVVACATNLGDCDDASANGCETNLTNSRTSCGRCGHDCLGGTCSSGQCQPVQLGTDLNNAPIHFVIDATYIYGINAYGTVTRRLKDGGSPVMLATGDQSPQWPPPHVALSGGALFYTGTGADAGDSGTVSAVSADGGASVVIASGDAPFAIGAAGAYVAWSESAGPVETSALRLCKLAPRPDGGPIASCASVATLGTEPGTVDAIGLRGGTLYYTNAGQTADAGVGGVRSCDLPACAPVDTLAPSAPLSPFALAQDGNALLWTTRSGYVMSCPYPCSAAETFDMDQPGPRFLAIDGANAFWTNADGTIRTVARTASPSRPRIEQILWMEGTTEARAPYVWDIAVDSTAVYWSRVNPTAPLGGSVVLSRLAR